MCFLSFLKIISEYCDPLRRPVPKAELRWLHRVAPTDRIEALAEAGAPTPPCCARWRRVTGTAHYVLLKRISHRESGLVAPGEVLTREVLTREVLTQGSSLEGPLLSSSRPGSLYALRSWLKLSMTHVRCSMLYKAWHAVQGYKRGGSRLHQRQRSSRARRGARRPMARRPTS